jgi:hypothetical protein
MLQVMAAPRSVEVELGPRTQKRHRFLFGRVGRPSLLCGVIRVVTEFMVRCNPDASHVDGDGLQSLTEFTV